MPTSLQIFTQTTRRTKQGRRGTEDKKKQEIGSMGRIKKPKQAKQILLFGQVIRIKKPKEAKGTEEKKKQEIPLFGRLMRVRIKKPKEAVALDPSVVQMELPQALLVAVEKIGGHDLVFVGKKQLTATDVNTHHDRLFVPKTTALIERLTRDERNIIERGDKIVEAEKKGKRIEAVKIVVVDAMGRLYDMEFKNWSSIDQLLIGSNWNAIVRENNLEEGDRVDLHVFRYESGKLGFAVNAAIRAQPINQVEPMDAEQNEDDWRESQVPFKFI